MILLVYSFLEKFSEDLMMTLLKKQMIADGQIKVIFYATQSR